MPMFIMKCGSVGAYHFSPKDSNTDYGSSQRRGEKLSVRMQPPRCEIACVRLGRERERPWLVTVIADSATAVEMLWI
uniref:Uncharacterized protein n=1 Tax=Nelumbo nucifera TaxID=4432 RepID=A0A822XUX3_NELNU|nr:TPA_asm: hypothetical protein HUJ06_024444 [Nelumbo nucifera]